MHGNFIQKSYGTKLGNDRYIRVLFAGRSSESANVHSRRNSQVLLIPDSPPPEYTPRHTHLK